MPYNRDVHHRRSTRLPAWDYRERGAYFVTICTHERELLFENPSLRLTAADVWRGVAWSGDGTRDEFIVMPNHMHGIIWLLGATAVGAQQPGAPMKGRHLEPARDTASGSSVAAPLQRPDLVHRVEPGSLAAIVRTFKAAAAKRINNMRGTPGAPVWQRNYYERVVHDDHELERVREYILDNPRRWAEDKYNPANVTADRSQAAMHNSLNG